MDNMEHNGFWPQDNENMEETVCVNPPQPQMEAPVYEMPAQPVQQAPVYAAPAQPQPQAPVYTAPVQQAPVYETPVQPAAQPTQTFAQPAPQCSVYRPVRPVPQPTFGSEKPAKKKKKSGAGWKIPLAIVLALLIAAGSSFGTIWILTEYYNVDFNKSEEVKYVTQEDFQAYQDAMDNKFEAQMEKVNEGNSGSDQTQTQPDSQVTTPAAEGLAPAQVYQMNVAATVAIANEGVSTNILGQVSRTASSGSGFIISADGYVVSNYHVVQGAEKLTVMLSDGTEYEATLIGYDELNDVSVLKVNADKELPYTVLGNSSGLVVGDQVCAIGNPLGELTSSLTVGYVSAMDRQISTESGAMNMIQTDAAINSGNSGGPLFNSKGEVIGINTAKYSGTSNSGATIEGIGFAIPIDDVKDIITSLVDNGYVKSAYLGVEVRDVDESGIGYGLPLGAFVQNVVDGGAAAKAGIVSQDIIVNLAGYEVKSVSELQKILRKVNAGEETTVTVYRNGQRVDLHIVPEEKPRG